MHIMIQLVSLHDVNWIQGLGESGALQIRLEQLETHTPPLMVFPLFGLLTNNSNMMLLSHDDAHALGFAYDSYRKKVVCGFTTKSGTNL